METLYHFLANHSTFTISASLVFILLISFYLRYRRKRKMNKHSPDLYSDDYLLDEFSPSASPIDEKPDLSMDKVETDPDTRFIPSLEEVVSSPPPAQLQAEEETGHQFGKIEGHQLIIALYVVAQRGRELNGADIFSVLEEIGLKYGEMNIFHHYGVGELKAKQAVFSVANIIEPGTFDLREIDDFTTPGLALFLRLPGPFGGRVAFELMLNSAQRMAEELRGVLQDERHQFLTQRTIGALRERIAQFEHR
jgi:cell division protein ZipA